MAMDPIECKLILENYWFGAWCVACGGLSYHEAMETLTTAARKGTSDSNTAAIDKVS